MTSRFRRIRHIRATVESGPWSYAETHAEAIESAWRTATAANSALFDGEVLVITERVIDGDVFTARYRQVRYAQFLHYMRHAVPDGVTRNGFAVAGLTGADGALVMGIMGGHTANAGRIYFPGGTPDPDDVVDGRVDLDGSVVRELAEETGLTAEELTFEPGFWLHEDEKRSAFIKVLHSPLPAADLKDAILARVARQAEPELAGVHIVRTHDDLRPDVMPPFQLAYAEWWLAGGAAAP